MSLELGVFAFGETVSDSRSTASPAAVSRRLAEVGELAEIAESVGLDIFGIGEHHREEFAISAPAVVLAAIAARTSRILLAGALTVLAAEDPVRLIEQFATVDSLSGGRVEIMVGRDSFPEAFSLFGHRLIDEEWLFDEKLRLLLRLADGGRVTWSGDSRPALRSAWIVPRAVGPMPIGIVSGASQPRVALAASLGLPLSLLMRAGEWEQYSSLVLAYRRDFLSRGEHGPAPRLTAMVPAHIATTFTSAVEEADRYRGRQGAASDMIVGDPERVVEQILALHSSLRPQRVMLEIGRGNMPHSQATHAVELLGTEVAPMVRRELASRRTT